MFNPFTFFIINGMSHCTSFISSYIALKFESIDRIHLSIDLVLKLCLPSTASFDLQTGWGGPFPGAGKFPFIISFVSVVLSVLELSSGVANLPNTYVIMTFFASLFSSILTFGFVCVCFFFGFFFLISGRTVQIFTSQI